MQSVRSPQERILEAKELEQWFGDDEHGRKVKYKDS